VRVVGRERATPAMSQAALTPMSFSRADILLKLTPQLAFDDIFAIENAGKRRSFVGQNLSPSAAIDARFLA